MRASLVYAAALAATALLSTPASAQSTVYVQLDYLAVEPTTEAAFVAQERAVWRPVHAERRRRGQLLDWVLYEVRYAPPGVPYDYVEAHVFGDLRSAEDADVGAAVAAAHPDRDAQAVLAEAAATREVVHSELWALVTDLAPAGADGPSGQHLAVNFMAVPQNGRADYFALENDVWAPIHQIRADDGSMGGWALYSLILPRGTSLDYQFGTVDFFYDLDRAAASTTDAQIRRAHPDASQAELDDMLARTDEVRSVVKTELWTRVATLDPPDS